MTYKRKRSFKPKTSTRKRRRTYLRAKRRYARRPRVQSRILSIIPERRMVSLPYVETVTIDPPAGLTPQGYKFVCNGVFDPNNTGAGHQPMGFDQLTPLYNNFVVVGATIRATFTPSATTTSASTYLVGIFKDKKNTGLPVSYEEIMEMGRGPTRTASYSSIGGDRVVSLRTGYSAKRDVPCTNPLDEPNQFNSSAANATIQPKWIVWAACLDNATDMGPLNVLINITYRVVCIKPKSPGLS